MKLTVSGAAVAVTAWLLAVQLSIRPPGTQAPVPPAKLASRTSPAESVPAWFNPELSAVVAPVDSSKFQAASSLCRVKSRNGTPPKPDLAHTTSRCPWSAGFRNHTEA